MKRTTAIKALLVCIGGLAFALNPATAQMAENAMELNGRTLAVSRVEQARLQELRHLLRSRSRGAQDRALAAVEAVANSPDARYVAALYKLEIGRARHDDALRMQALDVLIASDNTAAERLPNYLAARGDIAFRARDLVTASAVWGRLAALQPNDAQSLINLAQVRDAQGDAAGALDLIQRGIAARRRGPELAPVPEIWFRQWVSIAYNTQRLDQGAAAAQALVAAYPTPENWRFALVAYRQLAAPQAAAEIDLLRLMRAIGAFVRPDEYQRLAQLLLHAGFVRESRAVLDEGLARSILDRTASPTPEIIAEVERAAARPAARRPAAGAGAPRSATASADSLLSEGRFAEAAASYRALLAQGGVDRAMANTRLGAALALGGRRGEAETALRAAAQGADGAPSQGFYPDLARFWLAWLARSG